MGVRVNLVSIWQGHVLSYVVNILLVLSVRVALDEMNTEISGF